MRQAAFRLASCLLPLAMTPLWAFLIADGYLNFGGGEKDLLLLLPWVLWSLLYFVNFIVLWPKRLPLRWGIAYAAGGATVVLVLVWIVMFVWFSRWLGVS